MIDIGHTIGNYKITAKLGEGGMGVVYLAEHPVIGKKVAMKAIHPELSKNSDVVSRFVTEAKAVNQIGHEHIVDIADFGNTSDGEFYFVMEYLQGESLSDRLRREHRLDVASALSITAQIADALNASHEQGIIHRDLKPENIFLCINRGPGRDFVKVLDFGLAKLTLSDQKVSHKTRTGSVMGTPYYMSPEQCEGKIEIDHRADIYSLGVLLFEMLTGKVPFGGDGYGEIIVKHVTMPPPSVRTISEELPEEMDLILYRALAKDRDQRFQTMAEFEEALRDPQKLRQLGARHRHPGGSVGRGARRLADGAFRDGRALEDRVRLGAGPGTAAGRHPVDVSRGARRAHRSAHPEEEGRHACSSTAASWRSAAAAVVTVRLARRRRQAAPADDARRASPQRGAHQLQLRSGRRDRDARGRQDAGPDAALDRGALQRLGGRVPVQEGRLREEDRLRRPQPAVAAVRDAAQDRGAAARTDDPGDAASLAQVGVHVGRIAVAEEGAEAAAAEKQPLHSDDEDGTLEPSFGRP